MAAMIVHDSHFLAYPFPEKKDGWAFQEKRHETYPSPEARDGWAFQEKRPNLHFHYIRRLVTLRALRDLELDLLAFG
jgi:hypothetical protein